MLEKHIKDATEEIAEKAKQLELAKKADQRKEGNLKGKKGELEKIIEETDKEEKHYKTSYRKHASDMLMKGY